MQNRVVSVPNHIKSSIETNTPIEPFPASWDLFCRKVWFSRYTTTYTGQTFADYNVVGAFLLGIDIAVANSVHDELDLILKNARGFHLKTYSESVHFTFWYKFTGQVGYLHKCFTVFVSLILHKRC